MICNVGKIDRVVRALAALILIAAALVFVPTTLSKVLLLTIGMLLLLSAWFGVCMVYLAKNLEVGLVVQRLLKQAGIEVAAFGHNLLKLPKWFGGSSDGKVRNFVPAQDEQRAREILRQAGFQNK